MVTLAEVTENVRQLWMRETNDEVAHLLHAAYERLQVAERLDRADG